MARPHTPERLHLRSARMLDVDSGELVQPGSLLIEGERIAAVSPTSVPDDAVVVDLGDVCLLPGLMDMEVNLLLGGPNHSSPLTAVQDDPAAAHPARRGQCPPHAPGRLHHGAQSRASSSRPAACCSTWRS